MDYVTVADEIRISRIVLGGHEYLPDGRSRGFNQDMARAITPGYIFPGFGGDARKAVLRAAYDAGINCFDVTLDSEKEALGRTLAEMPPPYEVYVQTRPEGMVYSYDPGNRRMLDRALLRAEVQRILVLLRRERLDFLNLGILATALAETPDFLEQLGANIASLRNEGLIRHACADTFSGEAIYLAQIASGHFASLNVNFNIADTGALGTVCTAAREAGMTIVVREAFIKGALFAIAREAGIDDDHGVARAAMKWVLAHRELDAVIVGAGTVEQLNNNLRPLADPALDATESTLLERIRASAALRALQQAKDAEFGAAPR